MPHRGPVLAATCLQILRDALAILLDKRIRHRDNFGGRTVVLEHHDGARVGEHSIEIKEKAHVSAAPGVDGLVWVAHDEEVLMVAGKHAHEIVLQLIDVLKLIDHHVFQPLLPFQPNVRVLLEDVEHDDNKVVVVEPETLLLLIQIPVKNDVARVGCLLVLFAKRGERHSEKVKVVIRPILELYDLDHVARIPERHIAQRKPPLIVDDLQHLVDIGVVEHEKTLRVLNGVRILLQHRHAESVEGVDETRVVITGERAYAAAHLVSSLISEGNAQDVPRHDAEVDHQIREAFCEGARLARSRASDDAHIALRCSDSLELRGIKRRHAISKKRRAFGMGGGHILHDVIHIAKFIKYEHMFQVLFEKNEAFRPRGRGLGATRLRLQPLPRCAIRRPNHPPTSSPSLRLVPQTLPSSWGYSWSNA